jgi:hypothetical protein
LLLFFLQPYKFPTQLVGIFFFLNFISAIKQLKSLVIITPMPSLSFPARQKN